MTYGAQPSNLTHPAVTDIVWYAWRRSKPTNIVEVKARLWIDARDEAALKLGSIDPTEVVCISEKP